MSKEKTKSDVNVYEIIMETADILNVFNNPSDVLGDKATVPELAGSALIAFTINRSFKELTVAIENKLDSIIERLEK